MLGDQFTLIAFPWIVLQLTGSPTALAATLMTISIPRAMLILFGGEFVDRYSPKKILVWSKLISTVLLGATAFLIFTAQINLAATYCIAIGIGLVQAFSYPASATLLPRILDKDELQAGNSLIMGLNQLCALFGPVLAGVLIGHANQPSHNTGAGALGLGLAFVFDSISFAVSAWTLLKVRLQNELHKKAKDELLGSVQMIFSAWRHIQKDRHLKICCLYWAAAIFFGSGPMRLAIPILANTTLPDGPTAFGIMTGAHGAGALLGMLLSSLGPLARRTTRLGMTMLTIDGMTGILLFLLGSVHATWQRSAILLAIGALTGFVQITIFTWGQQRIPKEMIGRAMSFFMLMLMILVPVSGIIAGWVLNYVDVKTLLTGLSAILLITAAAAGLFSPITSIERKTQLAS